MARETAQHTVEHVLAPSRTAPVDQPRRVRGTLDAAYLGSVLTGSVLFVIAALNQPYSYDELKQISPYATGDPAAITSATRQPPLAPLAEAFVQHVLGEGQLQQRLLPVLSGIGVLVFLALLLRRHGLRYAGAAAVLVAATSPQLVRYSAYTRPYSEPLAVMLLFAWAIQSWLDTGRRRWLVVLGAAAFVMPLVRLPEPTVLLGATLPVLGWLALRRRLAWSRVLPAMAVVTAALASVGAWQFLHLQRESASIADTSTGGMLQRVGPGLHELVTSAVPVIVESYPWWPAMLAIVAVALLLPSSRRRLASWPMLLPLLAGPVAFVLAYHLAFRISFDALPYRSRFATFFLPALMLCLASLLASVEERLVARRRSPDLVPLAGIGLVAVMALGQLPDTGDVLTRDAAPDFQTTSQVVHRLVPDNAIVVYDRTTPAGASRQFYPGRARYLGDSPTLYDLRHVAPHAAELRTSGPVYLLFNGQCSYPGRCVPGLRHSVDWQIPGWSIVYRHDRFTLYAPDGDLADQVGHAGIANALAAAGRAMGPELGYFSTYAAAAVLRADGHVRRADTLVATLDARLTPDLRSRIRRTDAIYHFLGPAEGQLP